ncbi:MAG: TIGR03943 family protein [Caldilineaceae bacterium]|nr:TIGR03943 family protein [Caldilineaceae bacterium]
MLASETFQRAIKALLLIGLGIFLYSRIANGTLYFYISERYAWLTLAAVIGLLLVGISYRGNFGHAHHHHHHEDDDDHAHEDHIHEEHHHEEHHHHDHSHGLTWGGVVLVALPIVLGLLVPPQPLGASAMQNREIDVGGVDSVMPTIVRSTADKDPLARNILDWVMAFRSAAGSNEGFADVEAEVIGFVYRDDDTAADTFWVSRFIVGCCVADAAPVALAVQWGQTDTLPEGEWVRVRGRFREDATAPAPILVATQVEVVPAPNQPYLYP